jgi:hypothetical protein
VASGNAWTTPFVNNTTSFWVSSANVYGGGTFYGARTNNSTNGQFHTNADNYQLFTASEPFTLRSVKVYANGAGNRTIALIDQGTGATLASGTYSIPNGESRVQLDYAVPAGGPYGLRVVGGNPQLWRDGLGSNQTYPYPLGTVGSVISSSVAGNNATAYYYFFYDWEVEVPSTVCESAREEVVVNVGIVGLNDLANSTGIAVWPNPATDNLTVMLNGIEGRVSVDMLDLTGRVVMERAVEAAAKRMDLNVQGLATGEYVVRVRHTAGASVHRVVVR